MDIRTLGPEDVEAATALIERFLGPAQPPEALRAWLATERHLLIGAFAEVDGASEGIGLVYGYRLIHPTAGPEPVLLYSLDVAESHRRRGIGTRLVTEMERLAGGHMWVITNESNAAGMAVYARARGKRAATDDVVFVWKGPADAGPSLVV